MVFLIHTELRCTVNHTSDLPKIRCMLYVTHSPVFPYIRYINQLGRYNDWLLGWTVRDRIPVETRFSAHVQTCPGAHPASCTMGTGSFPGVNRPGCGVYHPTPSNAGVKESVKLYLYSPSWPLWHVLGYNLPLPLPLVLVPPALSFNCFVYGTRGLCVLCDTNSTNS